jgi:hypothetical protein
MTNFKPGDVVLIEWCGKTGYGIVIEDKTDAYETYASSNDKVYNIFHAVKNLPDEYSPLLHFHEQFLTLVE